MARSSVRQLWKAKLEGKLTAKCWPDAPTLQRSAFHGRVLGIDPSLRGTGLALIEFTPGRQPVLLRCQTVKIAPKLSMAHCLGEIHKVVAAFVAEFDPRHVALEQTIYVQNFQTAQILGAARGAAISAAALQLKEIFEYAPLRVKQAVTGRAWPARSRWRAPSCRCWATGGRWPSTRPTQPAWHSVTP